MNPKVRTSSISPTLRSGGRALIDKGVSITNVAGSPIGLLMALTYAINTTSIIKTWETVDTFSKPLWGFNQSLNSPQWAK